MRVGNYRITSNYFHFSLYFISALIFSNEVPIFFTEYRQQSDTVYLYMDEKGYEVGEADKVDAYQIHHDYQEYCKNAGYKPCALRTFNERLRNLGYSIVRHNRGMVLKYSKIKV
jgi:hypothetical protein